MTKSSFCAALAAVVLCGVLVSQAPSQQGNPGYPGSGGTGYQPQYQPSVAPAAAQPAMQPRVMTPVALLDVGRILDESSRMKATKQALQADVQNTDAAFGKEQDAIRKLQEGLGQLRQGSVEYKQLEEQIAKRISDLQVNAKLKRKELGERQSQALYTAYKEIEQEVQSIASERGIVMVLRIASGDVPQENLEAVYAYAGKNVVWFNRGLDITDEVLSRLERRSGYGGNPNMNNMQQGRAGVPMPPPRR